MEDSEVNTNKSIKDIAIIDSKLFDLNYSFVESNHDPLHIQRKTQQRGISINAIEICLAYGVKKRAIKAWNYTLTDRSLTGTKYEKYIDSLRGLTIIGNWSNNTFYIITSYWDFHIKNKKRY